MVVGKCYCGAKYEWVGDGHCPECAEKYARKAEKRRRWNSPEEWGTEEQERFDGQVRKACEVILLGRELERLGLYHPSRYAAAVLTQAGARDLDAELSGLLTDPPDQH